MVTVYALALFERCVVLGGFPLVVVLSEPAEVAALGQTGCLNGYQGKHSRK